MKCYILDDYTSVKIISQYISTFKDLKLVGSSASTLQAYSEIITLSPDIVFINSCLPRLNTDKLEAVSFFIYTADAPHFAAEAFENNAIDYLLKPFTLQRFSKCIAKVRQKKEEQKESLVSDRSNGKDYFFVRNEARGNKVIRIKYDEIIYIEASQNYVTIHLDNSKSHLIYLTMKEVEDFLPAHKFVRVHKSYLINEDRISSIDGNKIILDDLHTIVCGVSYRKELFNKVNPKLITSKRRFDKMSNDALEEFANDKRSN